MKPTPILRSFLILAGSSLLTLSSASAIDYWWDSNTTTAGFGNTTGIWGTSTFWGTSSAGTSATFNTTITSADTINFGTATLNYNNGTIGVATGGVTTGGIVIGAGQTTAINLGTVGNSVTIDSGVTKNNGSGNFIFASPVILAASQTWTNNTPPSSATAEVESLRAQAGINYGANTFTIDGIGVTGFSSSSGGGITGTGDFIKNGTGTVAFTITGQDNTATFSGRIFINGGVARYQNAANMGTGNITINGGILEGRFASSLTRAQGTAANEIQITGGVSGLSGQGNNVSVFDIGSVTWGSATFAPTQFVLQSATTNPFGLGTFASAINLNGADRTIRSDQSGGIGAGGNGVFSGNITNSTGTAGLIKTGIGHHIFSGTNTYNGNTSVNQGILTVTTTGALPGFDAAGRVTVAAGATLGVRTGAWTSANIDSLRTNATWSSTSSELGLNTSTAPVTYASNITEALTLTKYGTNNLTLSGTNTYTGNTRIYGGGLLVSSIANNLGHAGGVVQIFGGELEYTGAGETSGRVIDLLATAGTIRTSSNTGALVLTANVNPTGTGTKTLSLFGTNTLNNTLSGNISNGAGGTLAITKGLAGTWILSGTNTYTGATTVSGGTLRAGSNTAFNGTSALTLSGTSIFDLNGFNATFTTAGSVAGNTITNSSTSTGASNATTPGTPSGSGVYVDAVRFSGGTIAAQITDGATRKTQVIITNNNSGADKSGFDNNTNTFSGGLVLANSSPNGTRLNSNVITGTPFGTGPIIIGQANTDKAQFQFYGTNTIVPNNFVLNTAIGTDVPSAFRTDNGGSTLSGTILANLANSSFWTRFATSEFIVTGKISSASSSFGVETGAASLGTLTLSNATNDYTGATTVKAGTLVAGANAPSGMVGAFGNATSEILLGEAGGNSLARIYMRGDFVIGRNIRLRTLDTTDGGTRVLALGGDTAHNSTFSGNVTLGSDNSAGRSLNLNAAAGGQVTFSGIIQQPSGMDATTYTVTKTGAGRVVLSGNNTYAGATTVSAGTLALIGGGQNSAITVQTAAKLGFDIGSPTTSAAAVTLDSGHSIEISGSPTLASYTLLTTTATISGVPVLSPAIPGYMLELAASNTQLRLVSTGAPTGFAGWQAANGTAGTRGEDHDNDGVANGTEHFLGGNTSTTGFTAVPSAVKALDGTLSVTWPRHPDYPGFPGNYGTDFVVETSSTLVGLWTSETPLGTNVIITGNNVKYTFPGGPGYTGKNFVRLKVTGP